MEILVTLAGLRPHADWLGCGWSEALLDALLLSTIGMVDLIAARCPQR
jgi:hypothetical protein